MLDAYSGKKPVQEPGLRMNRMLLTLAVEADFPEIVALVNLAFRGTGATQSWNCETQFIEGDRLNDRMLREDLAAKPGAFLLVYRDEDGGPLLGTVWLEPETERVWYLGLLAVRPEIQKRQLGRALMTAAEEFARERGARQIRMTVVNVRETLVAWYERRGYALTSEVKPYPYVDQRFGRPLRGDLHFVVMEKDI
jgi:GNAT superfamily N-acetyltransferase